ncbi:MAG: hypothetical protein PUB42_00205 [Firmicutes bacterium]|nr:hypothetical protein [Bacillota bacterium]
MNINKKSIIGISLAALSLTVLFTSYRINSKPTQKPDPKPEENERRPVTNSAEIEEIPEPTETVSIIYYSIYFEDSALSMYEVNGEKRTLIKSIEINPNYYPPEDIYAFTKGINCGSKEEGFEILENFSN